MSANALDILPAPADGGAEFPSPPKMWLCERRSAEDTVLERLDWLAGVQPHSQAAGGGAEPPWTPRPSRLLQGRAAALAVGWAVYGYSPTPVQLSVVSCAAMVRAISEIRTLYRTPLTFTSC